MSKKQANAINWSRSGVRAALAAGSAIILLAIFFAGAARADDLNLLRGVLGAAGGHDEAGWAYTRTLVIDADAVGEQEKVTIVEKIDPSRPPGEQRQRVEIHEGDGKMTTEISNGVDVDVDRVVYADLTEIEFESAELVSQSDDQAVYRLQTEDGASFRFGGAHFGDSSLTDDIYAELIIQKTGLAAPYVSEVRVRNSDNSGGLFADIELLYISYRFAPSPDGTTYLSQGFDLDLEMDLLIFIDIDINITAVNSDYVYVGEFGS